ncbi:D-alanyl-D-alanine carboxypeptidase family protein [Vagococcus vulneris]|uniref:Peptidase S11 D-alanyl-D-alanine carboxypeptidase A N-terminal domain-containing protein n=1 Tax=Vagococcus vulneris TaxID=1977869 RepID=A0A429ZWF9_9ENTE|nr:D-alanyl-D-alanine carboxypeptidase [Vagococcus vulneris]RST98105.1 hypothetical protein CBF37_08715 [Vagococcus vulneris]
MKKIIRISVIILVMVLMISSLVGLKLSKNSKKDLISTLSVDSSEFLLDNLSSNTVILQKNINKKVKIASLTKLMTVYILINETSNLNEKVSITEDTIETMNKEGAALSGILPNDNITLRDLSYSIVLPSGGDAALTAAIVLSGNEKKFVKKMNHYATTMNMTKTNFTNATGLDTFNNYSTISDLHTFMKKALKNPFFKKLMSTLSYTTEPTDFNPEGYTLNSTILDIDQSEIKLDSGEIIGGKTGYTKDAGQCLISLSNVKGNEYLLITTGATGSPTTEKKHVEDSKIILNNI